jgi:hypothetical protein
MSFGGLFRRVEQGLLQSVGLVKSSMDEDDTYRQENARLEALDGCLRRLAEAAQAHMMSLTRSATAVLGYVKELDTSLAALPGPPGGGGAMDLKPLGRLLHAQRTVVVATAEKHLAAGFSRVGQLLKDTGALRADFGTRKAKVLDHDSYVRRVAQAEAALATAAPSAATEASQVVRKAKGKERDCAAEVAQLTARIRARLGELELAAGAEASEAALSVLATQLHVWAHGSEAAGALLAKYPGAAVHAAELAAAAAERGDTLYLSVGGAGAGSRQLPGAAGDGAEAGEAWVRAGSEPAGVANLSAALRSPYAVEGAAAVLGGGSEPLAVADSASLRSIHAAAAPAPTGGAQQQQQQQRLTLRPPSHAPGPARAPVAQARRPSSATSSPRERSRRASGADSEGDGGGGGGSSGAVWARALYDYPPAAEDELALTAGAFVLVLEQANDGDANWWVGRAGGMGGREGVFPANRVALMSAVEAAAAGLGSGAAAAMGGFGGGGEGGAGSRRGSAGAPPAAAAAAAAATAAAGIATGGAGARAITPTGRASPAVAENPFGSPDLGGSSADAFAFDFS